jgi:hypothetical protein
LHALVTLTMADIKSFDPTIPQDEVDRLFRKLKDTRLPEIPVVPDAGDDYGGFRARHALRTRFVLRLCRPVARVDQQVEELLARRVLVA